MQKKIYSNAQFFPEVARILSEGTSVTLRVQGSSMLPFIHGSEDRVILEKADKVALGDILLCNVGDHYVIHRLIARKGDQLLLMGDGNSYGKETCTLADVAGKVVTIIRPDGKRIDCYSKNELFKAKLWQSFVFVRPYLLAIYKRFIHRTRIV